MENTHTHTQTKVTGGASICIAWGTTAAPGYCCCSQAVTCHCSVARPLPLPPLLGDRRGLGMLRHMCTPECRDPPGRRSLGVEEGSILMFPHSKQHCYPTHPSCCRCDVGELAEIERIVDLKTHKQLFEWTGIELLFFANRAVCPRSPIGGLCTYT